MFQFVGAHSLTAFHSQPGTRWLIANGRHFGDAEARKIARALRSNTTLKVLALVPEDNYNYRSDRSARILLRADYRRANLGHTTACWTC